MKQKRIFSIYFPLKPRTGEHSFFDFILRLKPRNRFKLLHSLDLVLKAFLSWKKFFTFFFFINQVSTFILSRECCGWRHLHLLHGKFLIAFAVNFRSQHRPTETQNQNQFMLNQPRLLSRRVKVARTAIISRWASSSRIVRNGRNGLARRVLMEL